MRIILSLFLLTSCLEHKTIWKVLRCSPNKDVCEMGGVQFETGGECHEFILNAKRAQPEVVRTCLKDEVIK